MKYKYTITPCHTGYFLTGDFSNNRVHIAHELDISNPGHVLFIERLIEQHLKNKASAAKAAKTRKYNRLKGKVKPSYFK